MIFMFLVVSISCYASEKRSELPDNDLQLVEQTIAEYDYKKVVGNEVFISFCSNANALHKAAYINDHNFLSKVLPVLQLNQKFDVINAIERAQNGSMVNTPLEHACIKGNLECVKLLLDHGANPNIRGVGQLGDVLANLESVYVEEYCEHTSGSESPQKRTLYLQIIELLLPKVDKELVQALNKRLKVWAEDRELLNEREKEYADNMCALLEKYS